MHAWDHSTVKCHCLFSTGQGSHTASYVGPREAHILNMLDLYQKYDLEEKIYSMDSILVLKAPITNLLWFFPGVQKYTSSCSRSF